MAEDKSLQQMQAAGARVLQSTPGLAEKLVTAPKSTPKAGSGSPSDKDAMIADLKRQLASEQEKNRGLEDQYKYRVASFVKRETQTKNKIEALERRLSEGEQVDEHSQRMSAIENMHRSVVAGLECIQNNTAKILQDQEKDLMRAFRARLQEVSKDLEAQRSRKGEHSTELQARHRKVVAELHEAQELAQTFDKKNQQLAAENQRLVERIRTREDDRQALLRELVVARKEIVRLKAQLKVMEEQEPPAASLGGSPTGEPLSPQSTTARKNISQREIDQARLQQNHNRQFEREMAYRDAVQKLRRMVEAERRSVRSFKQQQVEMLQNRTELEVLLRQCLDDVKAEIIRAKTEAVQPEAGVIPGQRPALSSLSIHELSPKDRERVLELLLSQQRVVQLLYTKTFTQPGPSVLMDPLSPMAATNGSVGGGAKDDDFSWLADVIPGDA